MNLNTSLIMAIVLALLHLSFPLLYYLYLRSRWLGKPWDLGRDPGYRPRVTIIVPTYNEANLIRRKLDDIASQDYPRELVEIIVVDSASSDGTPSIVREWMESRRDFKVILVEEGVRRGKAFSLNNALKFASGEVVVVTDADSLWMSRDALANALSWFSDPGVGAVTCLKTPVGEGFAGIEKRYRDFYNIIRLGESKKFSTPVFHGELAAFRKSLLQELGGFPTDTGADDSTRATLIALRGYRAIAVDNALCTELVPRKGYHMWRIRRAQHLLQHFTKTLKLLPKAPREFKPILLAETWLHLFNPWLLLLATIILLHKALTGTTTATALLAVGLALLLLKPYRTWIATQLYLIVATIRNLWTKEIAWEKQEKRGTSQ
jgi:cellulose synthase/poly-beta-1,6-N-acetylglucosamine synthase-like glycosyltransferase